MKLTEHFQLEEFTLSQTAERQGIDNSPNQEQMENLIRTAESMEKARSILGNNSIHITSGLRVPALNAAIGGSKTSAHMDGRATDFKCYGYGNTKQIVTRLKESTLVFDQLIDEFGRWVHIGFAKSGEVPRRQVLRAFRLSTGKTKYEEI